MRVGLLAGTGLAAALVVAVLARYPDVLHADAVAIGFLAVLLLGLATAVLAALAGTRIRHPTWRGASRDGCRWGVLFGALWVVEMTIANLGYSLGGWTLVPYFASTWAVWLLTVFAGALAVHRYGQLWAGTLIGVWSGLVSGLIGLATMQVLVLAAMPVLRRDPANLTEFRTAGDLSTAIAGDFLAAGASHLVLVGLIGGSVLATIGGVIGLAFRSRPREEGLRGASGTGSVR
jgi:hypothetical protein